VPRIRQQGEIEGVLLAESLVAGRVVGADAVDVGLLQEGGPRVAELLAFDGAAGGVVLGIEEQDHGLVREPGRIEILPLVVLEGEAGHGVAGFESWHGIPPKDWLDGCSM
jgi:hypothetical protein